MSDSLNPTLDRRAFIRGTAGVVGAGVLAQSGLAALATTGVVSVAYFDGKRLIPADNMSAGDASIQRVTITLDARGKGALRGVNANFPVRVKQSTRKYAFRAWAAGGVRRKFEMPVDAKTGIGFTMTQGSAKAEQKTDLQLSLGRSAGPKLREGTYVIAAGKVNWNSYRFEEEQENGPLLAAGGRPTSLQYVVLTVERV